METTKMTIHRALAELKLIDSRIEKAITQVEPSGLAQLDKPVNGFTPQEEFKKNALSKYQSVVDLLERKNNIKSAIVKANSTTTVNVAGETMTIADAINFKSLVSLKRKFVQSLKSKHHNVTIQFNLENEKINKVALDNAKIMLGKQDDSKVKPTDEDVKNIVEPFVKRNEYHIIDPLKIEEKIELIENQVDSFEVEIDAVLSEINAITTIEI